MGSLTRKQIPAGAASHPGASAPPRAVGWRFGPVCFRCYTLAWHLPTTFPVETQWVPASLSVLVSSLLKKRLMRVCGPAGTVTRWRVTWCDRHRRCPETRLSLFLDEPPANLVNSGTRHVTAEVVSSGTGCDSKQSFQHVCVFTSTVRCPVLDCPLAHLLLPTGQGYHLDFSLWENRDLGDLLNSDHEEGVVQLRCRLQLVPSSPEENASCSFLQPTDRSLVLHLLLSKAWVVSSLLTEMASVFLVFVGPIKLRSAPSVNVEYLR